MKKLILAFLISIFMISSISTAKEIEDTDTSKIDYIKTIGFRKNIDIPAEIQIRTLFDNYQKYTNAKDLEKFLSLHDDEYCSSDGYDKSKLKELAIESWKEYPKVKYSIKVLSVNSNIDNATVITSERLNGITNTTIDFIKGNGFIDSESTSVYYLKKLSNEWKIASDFVINEKTSMRFGVAKLIPMQLDAPAIVAPGKEYTAILKINVPRDYVALISLNNESITFPQLKSTEVFRGVKADGVRERILISNNDNKNENAVASIGIAKPSIKKDNINISLLGMAFLSSRVNVISHKIPIDSTVSINITNTGEVSKK